MEHIRTQSASVQMLGVLHLLATATTIFSTSVASPVPAASTSSSVPGLFSLSLATEYITGIYLLVRLCLDHPDAFALLPHAIAGGAMGLNVALFVLQAGFGMDDALVWLSPVFWFFFVLDLKFFLGFRAVEWFVGVVAKVATDGDDVHADRDGVVMHGLGGNRGTGEIDNV